MAKKPRGNNAPNSGQKNGALASVLGILAVVASLFALTKPTNQRIDFWEHQFEQLTKTIEKIDERSHLTNKELATVVEHFAEIEAQFRGARATSDLKIQALQERVDRQEEDGNPRHDERIKALEKANGL